MGRQAWLRAVAALALSTCLVAISTPSWAAGEGNIDHVETRDGILRVLYSLPALPEGAAPDLASLSVSVDGTAAEATAEMAAAADAEAQVRRTAILVIDTSMSMRGERFTQAKAAADAFLAATPPDVYVGIVAFAGDVDIVHQPSLDRSAASAVLEGLSLSLETRLYDGVITAVDAADTEGQRSLLVLSDGRDTSTTDLKAAVTAISDAEVRVDVVALGQEAQANRPLEGLTSAGNGVVIPAADPEALTALFNEEAAALARQVLVTVARPDGLTGSEGTLSVSLTAGDEIYSDTAFVAFGGASGNAPQGPSAPLPVPPPSPLMSTQALWTGLGALGLGGLVVLLGAMGLLGKRERMTVEDKISAYTRAGAARNARAAASARHAADSASGRTMTESAVQVAQKALDGNSGFEAKLSAKLDGADLALKPAEWLLLHAGIAVGSAFMGLLLSSGGVLLTLVLLGAGALLPWMYLGIRKSRRLKAFNGQLAETLQLVAGSLSAGLSLAQSLDTVVREGSDPIAGEFRRALIEARLGVPVEDALESVAKRMESADFEWIVMAIRIQREVGGNLSELLLKVAATMRERDFLRRQVKTLSAEGKMSAWILGALPPGMLVYMMMVNPSYLSPLFTTPLGWLMLAGGAVLMVVGSFWMSRVVKVDV